MLQPVRIEKHLIGPGQPCLIIAEAGVNHNGNMKLAHRLIDSAAKAGADAVKFQSFITEELITPQAPKAKYQLQTTGVPGSQYSMLKALELSAGQQKELKLHCDEAGILYLCTPYDCVSADILEGIDLAAFKVASTDTTNVPLLHHIATKGRPVLLSTGMSDLGEVEQGLAALQKNGLDGKIVLLHCTSEYPAPVNEINLRAIITMQQAFGCPVGFSDHTDGIDVGPWAVAIGACVIEKHFTLDRTMNGPDHRASIETEELATLVRTVRDLEAALGDGIKRPMPSEIENKSRMQKSLVARRNIPAGAVIRPEDLTAKRPKVGLSPSWLDMVVGKRAAKDLPENSVLDLSSIEWTESCFI